MLAPAAPRQQQLYANASMTSWGGQVVHTNNTWHLYVTAFANGCGLWPGWMTNSLVVHATSPSLSLPFVYQDTVMDIYATNADAMVDPTDGTIVVLAMGEANLTKIERPCVKGSPVPLTPPPPMSTVLRARHSKSPSGPWEETQLDVPRGDLPNPSTYVHANGTVTMIVHTCAVNSSAPSVKCFTILRAPSWRGPWRTIAENFLNVPLNCSTNHTDPFYKCPCHIEDPTIWYDKPMGKWRVLMHQYPSRVQASTGLCQSDPDHYELVGGYAESEGEDAAGAWNYDYFQPAYSNVVETHAAGSGMAPAKVDRALRERPKVVLSEEGGLDGGWIINGACAPDRGAGSKDCFTVIQKVLKSS